MRLPDGARVAVIGAGPAGLVAAKHALEVGFDVTVFEASDGLGGQWHSDGDHSGVWPGMRTNTSRAMTAFSDFPVPSDHELHPLASQVRVYLQRYADAFGVTGRIRFRAPVASVDPGWTVDGEPFEGVIAASGRFRTPRLPPGFEGFSGEALHSFDYPGRDHFAGRRALVYGNGVSGHEIAADLAGGSQVVSAFRKPRYVLPKVAAGVPSDWQWYTHFEALRRRFVDPTEWGRGLRQRVLRVAGNPGDYGAPVPDEDILVAGLSLSQDYLARVRDGHILCRPGIAGVRGRRVSFTDGTTETVDSVVFATGYQIDLPYLPDGVSGVLGPDLALYHRTFHPDLTGLALIGMYAAQGPVFPLLELQARWIAGVWSGLIPAPPEAELRSGLVRHPPPAESHDTLALTLAAAAGVAPDPSAYPSLAEPLLFGPMLPIRYRFAGPGALADAPDLFVAALSGSPRLPPQAADLDALEEWGLGGLAAAARAGPAPAAD